MTAMLTLKAERAIVPVSFAGCCILYVGGEFHFTSVKEKNAKFLLL
jgi:hypothetical protein